MSFYKTKNSAQSVGLAPGTVVHVGERRVEKTIFQLIEYNESDVTEAQLSTVEECAEHYNTDEVTWINVIGLHNTEIITRLGEMFKLHPLTIEDLANTTQRPKFEEFDEYIFLVFKMFFYDKKLKRMSYEQVSLVLGKNFVLSFQEREGDVFDSVRDRIHMSQWKARKLGSDYLAYALTDALVDSYFGVLECVGDHIEALEIKLLDNPTSDIMQAINKNKRDLIFLRKHTWPLREVFSLFEKTDSSLIKKETFVYLRDVYDHTVQVIDTVEAFRDLVSGMIDTYLTSVSNRMNEIMKVLTLFSTIFIPMTFVTGLYGMNFRNMPEIYWHYGYAFAWGVIVFIAIGILIFFKKKKWL